MASLPDNTPLWKGLFDWSMKFQDGTHPSPAQKDLKPMDKERREWLEEAFKYYMQDFADRMTQIKKALEEPEAAGDGDDEELLETREDLLDELMDIVCSVDYARDLHKIGGLPPLLQLLKCRHPSLRSRAAEVVATCVANNPPVQRWFLEDGGVLPALIALLHDDNAGVRAKGLLALGSMLRHYGPAMDVAVTASGFLGRVVELAGDPDGRVCRKAAALVSYLLVQRRALGADVAAAAAVPLCAAKLGAGADGSVPGVEGSSGEVAAAAAASDDTYVRQGAASVLLELSRCGPGPWGAVAGCPGLGAAIQAAQQAHAALGAEEREAESEEGELLRSLAAAMAAMPAVPADESDHIELDAHDRSAARNRQPGQGQGKQPTATMEGPAAAAASAPALVLPPGGGGMIMGPKQDLR